MISIQKIKDFNRITDFLNNCFSAPTHWPDWNLVVQRFFNTNFFYLGAIENGNLIGICPIHETKKKIFIDVWRSGQFHFIPYGGWIFNKKTKVPYDFIKLTAKTKLNIYGLPLLNEFMTEYIQVENKLETLIIDLSDDIDLIWRNSIDSKRRNMIRKAERNKIIIENSNSINSDFYNLYYESATRLNLAILSFEFFTELFNNSTNVNFEIISARRDGKYISNIVIAYDKNYSIYWLGNNSPDKINLGQGELMQWVAIETMKSKNCKYYDLCYIDKEKLPHIYNFKKGFSKTLYPIDHLNYKSNFLRIAYKILK